MTVGAELKRCLLRASALLTQANLLDWAEKLSAISEQLDDNSQAATTELIRLYGGIGSINDLIIYRNGQPLIAENNEFDMLRTQMHQLAINMR